jgi:hypothetical protein
MRGIDDVISDVDAFQSHATESENLERLFAILEGLEQMPQNDRAVEPLFRLIERNSDADLGNPGPIVHSLEAIAPRSKLLAESLMRRPTFYTIWMVGRILNSEKQEPDRVFWLSQLEKTLIHPLSTSRERKRANEILARHSA